MNQFTLTMIKTPEMGGRLVYRFSICFLFALLLLSGCGPVRDMYNKYEADKEFEERAESGDIESQYELGRRYSNKKDSANLAIYWLCRAATQGHTGAQYTLAGLYERRANQSSATSLRRQQTLGDHASAYYWYTAAAAQGHEQAFTARERLGSKMTPESVAEAKRRARTWRQAQCIK